MYPEYAWWHDPDDDKVRHVLIVSRGAHASKVQYRANGLTWEVLVSNDNIEFIGDDAVDDED